MKSREGEGTRKRKNEERRRKFGVNKPSVMRQHLPTKRGVFPVEEEWGIECATLSELSVECSRRRAVN